MRKRSGHNGWRLATAKRQPSGCKTHNEEKIDDECQYEENAWPPSRIQSVWPCLQLSVSSSGRDRRISHCSPVATSVRQYGVERGRGHEQQMNADMNDYGFNNGGTDCTGATCMARFQGSSFGIFYCSIRPPCVSTCTRVRVRARMPMSHDPTPEETIARSS
mmetsp:Transcript_14456/g.39845  ORF Transcript_14456/g.39845 Transcript_14456/m.39845 type:complete len:162 (+) Transcript_14456:392-877(+)